MKLRLKKKKKSKHIKNDINSNIDSIDQHKSNKFCKGNI